MKSIGYAILVYLISTILVAVVAAWSNGWKLLNKTRAEKVRALNFYISALLSIATLLIMWR